MAQGPLRVAVIKWDGAGITKATHDAAARAIRQCAQDLLKEANAKCPHDEGTLERSGVWSSDYDTLQAAVSYDTPYAVRLHEHPEYHFQQGKEGKWLENPARERSQDYINWMARAISEALK